MLVQPLFCSQCTLLSLQGISSINNKCKGILHHCSQRILRPIFISKNNRLGTSFYCKKIYTAKIVITDL